MTEQTRRGFFGFLGAGVVAALFGRLLGTSYAGGRPERSKWTRTWVKRDQWSGDWVIGARYRDCSVPVGQRKKYIAHIVIPEEVMLDEPKKGRRQLVHRVQQQLIRSVEAQNPEFLTKELGEVPRLSGVVLKAWIRGTREFRM
jgi:hypothetical protein